MDPITLALLASIGGNALHAIPSLLPTAEDKRNKEQLAQLQALEKSGGFGISAADKSMIANNITQPALRSLEVQRQAPNAGTTGSFGAQVGAANSKAIAQDTARAAALGALTGQAASQVRAADLAKTEQQQQELESRIAYKSGRTREKLDAVFGAAGDSVDDAGSNALFNQMTGGGLNSTAPGANPTAPPLNPQFSMMPPAPTSVPYVQPPVSGQIAGYQQWQANPQLNQYMQYLNSPGYY